MHRKIYYWKLRDSELQLGERTLVMGVLNVTPDSFSDGGRFSDPGLALAHALEMEEHGADIIDIGAESTRPGSHRITADEEWQRLVPVLKRLRGALTIPLSLDTYKSEIAERALDYGVTIFNDPSGLTFDPGLGKVAANANAGLILNHMRGQPESWAKLPPLKDPLGTIARELEAAVSRARHAGVDRTRIVIDPGLGFGKRKEQNAEIIAHLHKLAQLDYPLLIGASRKSFLARESEADTAFATAGAVAIAALNGAHIVRVHDVREMKSVLAVADEIARASVIVEPAEDDEPVRTLRPVVPKARPYEDERPRPTRPPLAKREVPVAEVPVAEPSMEEHALAAEPGDEADTEIDVEIGAEIGAEIVEAEASESTEDIVVEAGSETATEASDAETPAVAKPAVARPVPPASGAPKPFKPSYEKTGFSKPPFEKRGKFDKPGYDKPRYDRPGSDRPSYDRPSYNRPGYDRPSADRPNYDRPNSDRPGSDRPRSDRPSYDRPSYDRPGFRKPPASREGGWDAPPKRDFRPGGPPRRDFRPDDRGPRPGFRPPERSGDRFSGPPRRDYPPSGPPSGPPRPRDDRPSGPPRDFRGPRDDRGAGPNRGFRPPDRGPRDDRSPRDDRGFRPGPRGDSRGPGGPPRDFRPSGPPRREGDSGPGPDRNGPPARRPFRKRP